MLILEQNRHKTQKVCEGKLNIFWRGLFFKHAFKLLLLLQYMWDYLLPQTKTQLDARMDIYLAHLREYQEQDQE